jgi:DNA polymerase-3 subunit delta'
VTAPSVQSALDRLAEEPEHLPASLLLSGASPEQLEFVSRRLTARLLCPGDDPDAACRSCRRVLSDLHPDFFAVEPEGVQIRVDRVREAIAFGAGRPYESPRRVARIARAEMLGNEAGNALLKSLEEPGSRFRWILTTTKPELLLGTIRSRCTPVALPAPDSAERLRLWESRGFAGEDARDLLRFASDEEEDAAGRLAEGREFRQLALSALEEGLAAGHLVPLLLLAAELAPREEAAKARTLSELLADAALVAAAPVAEAIRHRTVAGRLASIARRVPSGALREAALAAADPPADNRRGNRRLHYEKLLLELYAAAHAR